MHTTSPRRVDGGHRIRTCKGLRPPVFKTGALAIRPALLNALTYRDGRAYQSEPLRGFMASVYLRVPSSNKNGTGQCRFPTFFFDVLAEHTWNRIVSRPVTFRTVRPVHFPGKFFGYETLRNRHSQTCARQHALGGAGALRIHRVHPALGPRAARYRSSDHLGLDRAARRERA